MDAFLTAYNAGEYDQVMVVVTILVAVAGAMWFNHRAIPRRRFYKALRKAKQSLDSRGPDDGQTQWDIYEALDRWEEWQGRKVPFLAYADREFEVDAVTLGQALPPSRPRHVM